jgi:SAM-dependent methyltransferase
MHNGRLNQGKSKNLDLRQYYNQAYSSIKEISSVTASSSLVEFLELISEKFSFKDGPPRKTLELGTGLGGIIPYFMRHCLWPSCLDFSSSAIDRLRQEYTSSTVEFICENIVSFSRPDHFEFVFDSHLIHCLVTEEERGRALQNIFDCLVPGGIFALECMVRTKATQVEKDFYLDDQGVFWQVLDETVVPTRKINTALEMENEIIGYGFEIEYLMVHSEKKIIPHNRRSEVLATDPELMRIIARKSNT